VDPHNSSHEQEALNNHISQISTVWTQLRAAHEGPPEAAVLAQQRIVQRYERAVYRYLLAAVRNQHVADDLFQEFALRLIRGAFKNVSPERGRFRDFLRTTLHHLIVDHHRKRNRLDRVRELSAEPEGPADADSGDAMFIEQWRNELLSRAWEALEKSDREKQRHLYTVLHFRTKHPEMRAQEMAEKLSEVVGKPLSAEWIHKRLFLAREKFVQLLLQEVQDTLDNPTLDELESEIAELGLMEYCRDGLEQRRKGS
jgi:RNA polymerase sigma-70 factor (ECF subfamily)